MKNNNKNPENSGAAKPVNYTKYGTTSIVVTLVVVLLTVIINLLVSQLPSNLLEIDTSNKKIYSITDTSKDYVAGLNDHIELILIAEDADMDARIVKFCNEYAALSDNITVNKVDPVESPSYLTKYDVSTKSLVILDTDTGKYTTRDFFGLDNSLITTTIDYDAMEQVETAFDAEGQITSGIDFVIGDTKANVYALDGHEENVLSDSILSLISKTNIKYADKINLLKDGLPADCDLLICNVPTSDLADDELKMLEDYMQSGGNFFLIIDETGLTNFDKLISEYGLTLKSGTLGDSQNYYKNYSTYYGDKCFAPVLSSTHPITTAIYSNNAIVLFPRAMVEATPARDSITVKSFLTTSEGGILYDENDAQSETGTFIIGATANETLADGKTSQFTVVSGATMFVDNVTSSFTNMSNLDVFVNAVTSNFSDLSFIVIPSKSLQITYNTISSDTIWRILFIGVIPGLTLLFGLIKWGSRRKR